MAINAGSAFVELSAKVDYTEFKAYDRALNDVREKARKRDYYKAQLGGDYDAKAFNSMERDLKKVERQTTLAGKAHGKLISGLKSTAGIAIAAGGFTTVTAAIGGFVKAAGDAEASQKRVETAVKNAGLGYQDHAKHIDDVIQKQSKLSAFDDEDLADSFGKIVGLTKDVNEALRLNGVAADVARGRQISLESASKLVTRAAMGNAGALKRLGIEAVPVTAAQDKLKDSGHKFTRQQMEAAKAADTVATKQDLISRLQKQFAGQADAYGHTTKGAFDRVGNSWENLQEKAGKKLAPALSSAADSLARLLDEMESGQGSGGSLVRVFSGVADGAKVLGGLFAWVARQSVWQWDLILHGAGQVIGILEKIASAGAKLHFPGAKAAARELNGVKDSIDGTRRNLQLIAHPVETFSSRIRKMGRDAGKDLDSIRKATGDAMGDVARKMGAKSKEGTRAMSANFSDGTRAIRRAMRNNTISTDAGLKSIEGLLRKELKFLGLSLTSAQIKDYARSSGHGSGHPQQGNPGAGAARGGRFDRSGRVRRDGGGWVGERGQVTSDSVPAMLGMGEAVLNRHQQAVVEGLLGDGFLDRLFTTVDRPHYLAKGGRAGRFAGGGMAGAIGAANAMDSRHFPYSWGGGHEQTVVPLEPVDCSGAVSYVLQHAGVDIPSMVSGQLALHGRAGAGPLTVFANPTHTFMRIGNRYFGTSGSNPGGGAGWFPDPGDAYKSRFAVRNYGAGDGMFNEIKPPTVEGGGTVGAFVQASLNATTGGANRALRTAVASMGIGLGDPGDPGPGGKGSYGKARLADLWRGAGGPSNLANLAAAIAMAESRGDPNASNTNSNGSIDRGLWQINSVHGAQSTFDVEGNARAAVNIWRAGGGFGPWTTYNSGAYRQFLARGGRVLRAARGIRSSDPVSRARRRKAAQTKAAVKPPRLPAGVSKLKWARGWGVDYVNGRPYDIYAPDNMQGYDFSGFGRQATRDIGKLELAGLQAELTPQLSDDLNVARLTQGFYQNIYNSRVFTRAPRAKVRAALEQLLSAKQSTESITEQIASDMRAYWEATHPSAEAGAGDAGAPAAVEDPNLQALLDQANARTATAQATTKAGAQIQQAFSSSGDIGYGGFGNAFQAAGNAPRVTIINTLHPGDPATLAAVAQAANSGNSLAPNVAASRTAIGV